MPGSYVEIALLAVRHAIPLTDHIWEDGTRITDEEMRTVQALRLHHIRGLTQRNSTAQRKAMKLLRSLLCPEQKRMLRSSRCFNVTGSNGGTYRIYPRLGYTYEARKHGKHWFTTRSFCLHDDWTDKSKAMPPADLSVAHLLLLRSSEQTFLATANATNITNSAWEPGYRQRLAEARRARSLAP